MKKLFLPILACMIFFSCASDEFAGVEESASFKSLETYYNQIDDWNDISLNALEHVPFQNISSTTNYDCGGEGTTTTASLNGGHGSALSLFAETLGFESVTALNNWYIDFGKVYYDLIIEQRPENKATFINHVSNLYNANANACVQGCMNQLSYSAYTMGRQFGVRTNVGVTNELTQNHVFGTESAAFHAFTMLDTKLSCGSSNE